MSSQYKERFWPRLRTPALWAFLHRVQIVRSVLAVALALTCLTCSTNVPQGSDAGRLYLETTDFDALLSKSLLLIGETHKKEQSFILVKALLDRALDTHTCVALAVEIPSDQQQRLDAVRAGTAAIDRVEIWDALDFPPYRAFLAEILQRSAKRPCFSVHAVDLPVSVQRGRDSWMAERIEEVRGKGAFVIALLGTLHVVRGIRYVSFPDERNVADRLEAANLSLIVLVQDWPSECSPGLVLPRTQAFVAFVDGINRIINGTVLMTETSPADAVLNLCS